MQPFIRLEQVSFSYQSGWALQDISLEISQGEYVAVIGPNGSGKSTLAKLLNGLLTPSAGKVLVGGLETQDKERIWDIRRQVGMVFQNPDNQLVGTTVEEDVAFGPENYGVARPEIIARVNNALQWVDIESLRDRQPSRLSGGQKQRVAIAGALALQPLCLVLDEPTSMLDPRGRRMVMESIGRLHRDQGLTIVHITHLLEETLGADRILVLDQGRVMADGQVEQIFAQTTFLGNLGLELLQPFEVQQKPQLAKASGAPVSGAPEIPGVTVQLGRSETGQTAEIQQTQTQTQTQQTQTQQTQTQQTQNTVIALENVGFIYGKGKPWETRALKGIDLHISQGEFVGLCGSTGSGKSSLLHLLNGLLKPASGKIRLLGKPVWEEKTDFRELRRRIGLLFQNPEDQMFETTVFDEVAYGPRNQRWSKEKVKESTLQALEKVGLIGEDYSRLSPFALSGGQKRKVALAGILAMEPEILVLDEPLSGLDGFSRKELLALLTKLNREKGTTIVMVSHNLVELLRVAARIVVLNEGEKVLDVPAYEVFSQREWLDSWGLEVYGWKTF